MKFAENYFAVGAAIEADRASCVVLVVNGEPVLKLSEHAARKLADDILRNANHLWPIKEENQND